MSSQAAEPSSNAREWKLARRSLAYGARTLVMGVLNVTPDSFSDGGEFFDLDRALAHAEEMFRAGADIIDVGGESTRPGGAPVEAEEETRRVVPVVEAIVKNFDVPVSVDTTKSRVARAALDAGAEILNDISALRFDPHLADEAARAGAGLVLMHSRGEPDTLHVLPPVEDIMTEVTESLRRAVEEAVRRGVAREAVCVDPGVGFGKTHEQNVELLARLDRLAREFEGFPLLVGTSRKRFVGTLLGDVPVHARLHGTMATVTAAALRGAAIVRVHDVAAAVQTVRVADAIKAVTGDG
ncbi:MAG TPA: dihydropteroate synthase [Pyrinomonadaceae bacterium]|nr:dihydropteroate synthase [Pyrinomonadaceae bacterium]